MSARMETEPVSWKSAERTGREKTGAALREIEIEHLDRSVASARREQWDTWFNKRDQMRMEIKRGWELLEQVQRELAVLRARLDEWAGYELVCGKNPLSDYMQTIAAKERIEQYLPIWLKRREEQLHALDRQMEHGALQTGTEELS